MCVRACVFLCVRACVCMCMCVCVCVCVHTCICAHVCAHACVVHFHTSKRLAGGRGGSVTTALKQLVCTMQAAKRCVNCPTVYSAVLVLTLPGSGALT